MMEWVLMLKKPWNRPRKLDWHLLASLSRTTNKWVLPANISYLHTAGRSRAHSARRLICIWSLHNASSSCRTGTDSLDSQTFPLDAGKMLSIRKHPAGEYQPAVCPKTKRQVNSLATIELVSQLLRQTSRIERLFLEVASDSLQTFLCFVQVARTIQAPAILTLGSNLASTTVVEVSLMYPLVGNSSASCVSCG